MDKIAIIGSPGAGKSTLAQQLGESLNGERTMVQRDNILELAGVPPSELKQIKEKRDQEPGNVALDWDYGQAKIEVYINDNVEQMKKIFKSSMVVMSAGGLLIFISILIALIEVLITNQPSILMPAAISGFAGIITEFIGATFLFIYRSTIQQASSYIKTLERINSVDMAMKIINTMSDDSKELKDTTKSEMVSLLLQNTKDLSGTGNYTQQKKIKAMKGKKKIATPE